MFFFAPFPAVSDSDITSVYRRLCQNRPNSPQLYTLPKTPMPVLVDFLRDLWYNTINLAGDILSPFFIARRVRGFFYLQKGIINENTGIFAATYVVTRIYG